MNWPEAFAAVGGAFAVASLWIGLMHGGWPDIHIHRHYHQEKRKVKRG